MIRQTLAASCITLALSANANATPIDEELAALKARIEQLESQQQQAREKEEQAKQQAATEEQKSAESSFR